MTNDIRVLLAKYCGLPKGDGILDDTTDLYAAGLTSAASVQLMLALEDHFDVEFPDRLLNRKTFSSVAQIAEAIASISAKDQAA